MQNMPNFSVPRVGILLLLLWIHSAPADSSTLDLLYKGDIPEQALQTTHQAAAHIVNGETENARSMAAQLNAFQTDITDAATRARVLMNHGTLLVALGEPQAGTISLREGLALMEAEEGALSIELAKGLIALGIAEVSMGVTTEGEESLLRAQNLIHREAGVYAIGQEIIPYQMIMMALDRGDLASADRLQRFSLLVAEHSHGETSPKVIPTLLRLGSYFASRGSMLPMVSHEAMRPQDGFLGAKLCTEGIAFKPRPCNPGIDKWQAAQFKQSRAAAKLHIEREELFKESIAMYERAIRIQEMHPVRLVPGAYQTLALDGVPSSSEGVREYFALVEYDVSKTGKVEDIRIVEANVPGPQVRSLRSELLRARFRPRIEVGQLVDTTDIQIRFTYPVQG